MASIRFYVKAIDNNRMQIYCKVQHGAVEKPKSLGLTIPSYKLKGEWRHWDKKKYEAKVCPEQDEVNAKIADWKKRFTDYKRECTVKGRPFDVLTCIALLDSSIPIVVKGTPTTLLELAQAYHDDIRKTHKPSTVKGYHTAIENIRGYQKLHGEVYLEMVNETFYKNYGLYLIEQEKNFNNTINRKIGRIVTLMNYAAHPSRKWTVSTDYNSKFTFKGSEAARFALTAREYEKLQQLELTNGWQADLDAFLFSCETTLRWSDVTALYPHHRKTREIQGTTIHYLDLTQEKTTHVNTLALSEFALMLWVRNCGAADKKVFRCSSGPTVSRRLKDIFTDAKLTRKVEIVRTQGNKVVREIVPISAAISFHMSRNTAISNQLVHLSPATVMENAGIRKMETLMKYNKDHEDRRFMETLAVQNKAANSKKN